MKCKCLLVFLEEIAYGEFISDNFQQEEQFSSM